MKPRIGIIVCGLYDNRQFVTNAYIQSVRYAGGLPFLLPLIKSSSVIEEYVALCDGFLFCGGADITPLLFGQEPVNGIGETNIRLDIFQIRFMKKALASGKPILAICRGMQILNVACGGTIYQDISLKSHDTLNHMQYSTSRTDISHKVTVKSGTALHQITGKVLYTNSFHHQAIEKLGLGLIASAQTSDHIIEAVEMPSRSFVMGIQWHPEAMFQTSEKMRQLFRQFIKHSYSNG